MKLIDTHFHLDFYRDHKFWYEQINELKQHTLCVTNSPEIFISCKRLYPETKYVKFALGYNPQISASTPFNKKLFLSQLGSTAYIGEVGLDFTNKHLCSKTAQIEAFEFICHNAAKYNKLLTIHSRKAEKDTLAILMRNGIKRAIIHWYSGDLETLEMFTKAGYYFSINASMCVTAKGQSIIKHIPIDKILVESDGPFTKVGGSKYTPADLSKTYLMLADLLKHPNIHDLVFDNSYRLLTTL